MEMQDEEEEDEEPETPGTSKRNNKVRVSQWGSCFCVFGYFCLEELFGINLFINHCQRFRTCSFQQTPSSPHWTLRACAKVTKHGWLCSVREPYIWKRTSKQWLLSNQLSVALKRVLPAALGQRYASCSAALQRNAVRRPVCAGAFYEWTFWILIDMISEHWLRSW